MAIDRENLPKDLKEQEEKDAMVEGTAKFGMGLIGLFTTPWLGVAVAGAGVLTYAASFFVSGEKRLEYQSNGIKAMLGGLTLSFPLTSFLVMIEGGVTAISGRRDGPFAPIANISRFIAEGITGYPQTDVEKIMMHREMEKHQQSIEKAQQQAQTIDQSIDISSQLSQQKQPSTQRKAPIEQQPPAQEIDISNVTKARTYNEALDEYSKSLKAVPKEKKFVQVGKPIEKDGVTTIIFEHPSHPGDPKYQVIYQRKDGKIISIAPGESVSCTFPPIAKDDGKGFEIISADKKKQTVLHESGEGSRTAIVQAKPVVESLAGGMQNADSSTIKLTSTAAAIRSAGSRPSHKRIV